MRQASKREVQKRRVARLVEQTIRAEKQEERTRQEGLMMQA